VNGGVGCGNSRAEPCGNGKAELHRRVPLTAYCTKSGHLYIKVALSICQLTHSLWDCRASEEVQVASDPMQQPFHQLQLWQIITNIICYTAFSAAIVFLILQSRCRPAIVFKY